MGIKRCASVLRQPSPVYTESSLSATFFKDLAKLESSYKKNGSGDEGSSLEIDDLEIFENVAYIMAYHADHSIPGTIDEWLDQFEMFSIYEVLPEILELWGTNLQAEVESKKTSTQ